MNNIFLDDIDPDMNYSHFSETTSNSSNYFSLEEYIYLPSINNISIINYNIRSFREHFDKFLCSLPSKHFPEILCLTETWFNPGETIEISGFSGFHVCRSSRSGSVSIYVRSSLKCEFIEELSYVNDTIEVCTVEIHHEDLQFVIICIYRPHSDSIVNFNFHLSSFLNHSYFQSKTCLLMGDLNICLLKEDANITDYLNILFSHHFSQVISKPTRFSPIPGIAPSLLDHIFINRFCSYTSGIIDLDLTDHLPNFIHLNDLKKSSHKVKIEFRHVNEESKIKFMNLVSNFDWNSIIEQDIDVYASNFVNVLNNIFCDAFPLKTKFVNNDNLLNPWRTSEITDLLQAKSRYFYLYRNGLVTKAENNSFKNRVNRLIKKLKIEYSRYIFQKHSKNMKKTWKHINCLLSKNVKNTTIRKLIVNDITHTNEIDIANIFNNYFCTIGSTLDQIIPFTDSDPLRYVNTSNETFLLNPVSCNEIENILNDLKNSRQSLNCISIPILKEISTVIAPILADLINACFVSGVFPKIFKKALVLPLFKKGSITEISNYRPISILPTFSKVIEKCLKVRLTHFLSSNNILAPQQFGFQTGLSTEDAILNFLEHIYANINNKLSSIGIFVDFQKAFDTVNRDILLQKLEKYGIRGNALDIFASFLSDRFQSVKIGNSISENKQINIGIPQGSVLGPLCFLVIVNEIPLISNFSSSCMFADDTSFLFSHADFDNLFEDCNLGLESFFDWCCANRLSVNISKTKYMIFSNNQLPNITPDLCLNNIILENVSSIRFLGIELDKNLKFNQHILDISKKISKTAGIIRKLNDFFPRNVLISLYYSLIEPHINYCCLVFGGTYNSHLDPLLIAQKKCIRAVAGASYLAHTNPLFFSLKILKFNDLYKYNLGVYMYRNLERFSIYLSNNVYNTRTNAIYNPPFQRLNLCQRQSIEYQAPNNWNEIPESIRNSSNLMSFKINYKSHLVSKYYS